MRARGLDIGSKGPFCGGVARARLEPCRSALFSCTALWRACLSGSDRKSNSAILRASGRMASTQWVWKYLPVLRFPVVISLALTACRRSAPASNVCLHLVQQACFARAVCVFTRQSLIRFPVGGAICSVDRRSAVEPWRPRRLAAEVPPVPVFVVRTTDTAPGCCAPALPWPIGLPHGAPTSKGGRGAQGGEPLARGSYTQGVLPAHTRWEFHCARRAGRRVVGLNRPVPQS